MLLGYELVIGTSWLGYDLVLGIGIEATTARECPYVILLSFRLWAFYNPTPCPMKLTCRYIFYVELYSGVVLFSLIFRVRVRVRYRVRV